MHLKKYQLQEKIIFQQLVASFREIAYLSKKEKMAYFKISAAGKIHILTFSHKFC